jgi:hypothetical protein
MYGAGPVVTVALLLGASFERAAAACVAARLCQKIQLPNRAKDEAKITKDLNV